MISHLRTNVHIESDQDGWVSVEELLESHDAGPAICATERTPMQVRWAGHESALITVTVTATIATPARAA